MLGKMGKLPDMLEREEMRLKFIQKHRCEDHSKSLYMLGDSHGLMQTKKVQAIKCGRENTTVSGFNAALCSLFQV